MRSPTSILLRRQELRKLISRGRYSLLRLHIAAEIKEEIRYDVTIVRAEINYPRQGNC